jgi:hypothetical protein
MHKDRGNERAMNTEFNQTRQTEGEKSRPYMPMTGSRVSLPAHPVAITGAYTDANISQ